MIDYIVLILKGSFEQFLASLEMRDINFTHKALDFAPHSLFLNQRNADIKNERR